MDLKDILDDSNLPTPNPEMEVIKRLKNANPAYNFTKEALDKTNETLRQARELSGSGISGLLSEARRRASEGSGIANMRELLRQTMEQSSLASIGVRDSIANFPPREPNNFDLIERYDPTAFEIPEPPPNPTYETNRQLRELTDEVAALIDLAKQQANLTQALHETTKAALELAAQSGEEAKASSELAKISIDLSRTGVSIANKALIVTIIVGALSVVTSIAVPIYLDYHHQTADPVVKPVGQTNAPVAAPPGAKPATGLPPTVKSPAKAPATPLRPSR